MGRALEPFVKGRTWVRSLSRSLIKLKNPRRNIDRPVPSHIHEFPAEICIEDPFSRIH